MPNGKKTRGGKATKMKSNAGAIKKAAKRNAAALNKEAKMAGTRLYGERYMKDMGGGVKSGYATMPPARYPKMKVKKLTTPQGRKNTKKSYKR